MQGSGYVLLDVFLAKTNQPNEQKMKLERWNSKSNLGIHEKEHLKSLKGGEDSNVRVSGGNKNGNEECSIQVQNKVESTLPKGTFLERKQAGW